MQKKAFTLIELLVVIAIIAILAAILFPVFAQAKLAAKKTAGLSQAKQIGTSMHMYLQDYDDTFFKYRFNGPTGNGCSGLGCINTDYQQMFAQNATQANTYFGANARDVMFAKQLLDPYVKSASIWLAPTQVGAWSGADASGAGQDPLFRSYGGQNSYGLNGYLFTPLATAAAVSATSIENPSATIVMADASYYNVFPKNPCKLVSSSFDPSTGTSYPNYWKNLGNAYYFAYPAPPAMTDAQWMAKIDARYNGILNTVRADSSAKSVKSDRLVNDGPKVGYKTSIWDPYGEGCN